MLIQVSPTERGGVSDYLQCLKERWALGGVASHVLPMSKGMAGERSLDGRISDLLRLDGKPGRRHPCSVVLHFSGYGYADRGLCFWLLREVQALKAQREGALHLVIVFHELFAQGPPWRSAFWVSGAQALIAGRLARLADVVWTNTARHAAWLREAVPRGTPLHMRPVFSNVGEPQSAAPLHRRRPRAVVFGSAPTRQRAFAALGRHEAVLRALGVEEVVEVGSGASCESTLGLPTRHLGQLAPNALADVLLSSRFGVLDYESYGLAKSGVFAAYAAHGCMVLNTGTPGTNGDGVQAGRDYLALAATHPAGIFDAASMQECASKLHLWYQSHRLDQQARELLALATAGSMS